MSLGGSGWTWVDRWMDGWMYGWKDEENIGTGDGWTKGMDKDG